MGLKETFIEKNRELRERALEFPRDRSRVGTLRGSEAVEAEPETPSLHEGRDGEAFLDEYTEKTKAEVITDGNAWELAALTIAHLEAGKDNARPPFLSDGEQTALNGRVEKLKGEDGSAGDYLHFLNEYNVLSGYEAEVFPLYERAREELEVLISFANFWNVLWNGNWENPEFREGLSLYERETGEDLFGEEEGRTGTLFEDSETRAGSRVGRPGSGAGRIFSAIKDRASRTRKTLCSFKAAQGAARDYILGHGERLILPFGLERMLEEDWEEFTRSRTDSPSCLRGELRLRRERGEMVSEEDRALAFIPDFAAVVEDPGERARFGGILRELELIPFKNLQGRTKDLPSLYTYKQSWRVVKSAPSLWEELERIYRKKHPQESNPPFTEETFYALIDGFAAALAEASIASGNEDIYSGADRSRLPVFEDGEELIIDYFGDIWATKSSLCRKSFGEAGNTSENRAALFALIEELSSTRLPIPIYMQNGKPVRLSLCHIDSEFEGAVMGRYSVFHIHLNPFFRAGLTEERRGKKGRGRAGNGGFILKKSSDIDEYAKAGRNTAMKRMLYNFLVRFWRSPESLKGKENIKSRNIADLMKDLGYKDRWEKRRGRIEEELVRTCEILMKMKTPILLRYEVERNARGFIERVHFHINPLFNITRKDETSLL